MIVLSLFDGMSCGYEALKRAGVKVTKYYASEIDKHAIKIAKKNHPDIIHLGDVNSWRDWQIEKPDLIIGGSPCQGFSFAGQQLAFDDPRSVLFFTMMDIIDHYKPQWRYLENVRMKKSHIAVITKYMRCDPKLMNSALVSAQNRERYYWCNWQISEPNDQGIYLKDILEDHPQNVKGGAMRGRYNEVGKTEQCIELRQDQKANCLTTVEKDSLCFYVGDAVEVTGNDMSARVYDPAGKRPTLLKINGGNQEKKLTTDGIAWRVMTPLEYERAQTLDDNYTDGVSPTQRRNMCGNGWTVDMVAHHFSTLGQPIDPKLDGRLI